ncbi:hypothetical protein HUJ05_005715 [Dendroctonus ponderosae]|nr:hypothetical protein HUJ05_005715 [Dendroctonus ponderosae]
MRLKVTLRQKLDNGIRVTCVGWSKTDEVYLISEDNQIRSWSTFTTQPTKIAQLDPNLFATDLQFLPRHENSLGRHGVLILITSSDGKFHLMNRSGRIERSVDAHKGAILVGQWNNDGTGLLTAGEDGCIKIWSKSGMLRSTVINSDSSVYGACWSPDCQSIAYTHGKSIVIKQLAPNNKPLKWSRSLEMPQSGSIYKIVWSNDGTQLTGTCANGNVLSAYLVDRHSHYLNFSVTVSEKKTISVRNVLDDTVENLELPDRIIQLMIKYSNMILTTPTQCYIYSTNNWNTPFIFELKDGAVSHLEMSEKLVGH